VEKAPRRPQTESRQGHRLPAGHRPPRPPRPGRDGRRGHADPAQDCPPERGHCRHRPRRAVRDPPHRTRPQGSTLPGGHVLCGMTLPSPTRRPGTLPPPTRRSPGPPSRRSRSSGKPGLAGYVISGLASASVPVTAAIANRVRQSRRQHRQGQSSRLRLVVAGAVAGGNS
jgi:hypothetical protein